MVTVFFDGIPYQVRQGRNLLEAALDNGLNLPYFCWHPVMRSIGACRQCAVRVFKDENDQVGRIMMACMTDAKEGTRANIQDPEVIAFRRSVIEWLMINHPHDCPVCDEGGECHLQDMTTMTGHVYRRYRNKKRTYNNQNLGPFINHEMNRCIQCYRCVRYYRELAGGRDLDVFGSKDRVYFGRYEDGVLESEFSGNLVEVCPTGVFTDKTLASHYTRKWDLETAPSICPHCSIGCNITPGARYKEIRRIQSRYNHEVNGHFICDRGRFGYEFINQNQRIREAFSKEKGQLSMGDAILDAIDRIKNAKWIVGIGSSRASLESNYALRELVGEVNFSPGIPDPIYVATQQALKIWKDSPVRNPSLSEIAQADAILLLSVDPTNEAPMLDFAIRQAANRARLEPALKLKIPEWDDYGIRRAVQETPRLVDILTVTPIKLGEIARNAAHGTPAELIAMASKIADGIRLNTTVGEEPVDRMVDVLLKARQPVVITSASAEASMVRAAANIVWALKTATKIDCQLSVVVPNCNTMGSALMGGRPVSEILSEIESGKADTLIILENDLYQLVTAERVSRVLSKLKNLIVLDCVESQTQTAAHLVFPSATYAESNGTYVNNEGRAQRFFQIFIPEGDQRESWKIIAEIQRGVKRSASNWKIYEDVTRELSKRIPSLSGAIQAAPSADWRIFGMKVSRQPHRYSGRTAINADKNVRDEFSPPDPETPFAFTSDAFQGQTPPALNPRFWAPGWNSIQSVTRFQEEIDGPLRGGSSGARLIEPGKTSPKPFSLETARTPGEGEFWLIPVFKIFGSEKLSSLAARIREVIPAPYLSIHPEDAKALGIRDGEIVKFPGGDETHKLPIHYDAMLPRRVVTVPAGYPETRGIVSAMIGTIGRAG